MTSERTLKDDLVDGDPSNNYYLSREVPDCIYTVRELSIESLGHNPVHTAWIDVKGLAYTTDGSPIGEFSRMLIECFEDPRAPESFQPKSEKRGPDMSKVAVPIAF